MSKKNKNLIYFKIFVLHVFAFAFIFVLQSCQPRCHRKLTVCEPTTFFKDYYSRINESTYWIFKEINSEELDTLKTRRVSKGKIRTFECIEYETISIELDSRNISIFIMYPFSFISCNLTQHSVAYHLPQIDIKSRFRFFENDLDQLKGDSIELISEIEINGSFFNDVILLKSPNLDLYFNKQGFIFFYRIKSQSDTLLFTLNETNFQ